MIGMFFFLFHCYSAMIIHDHSLSSPNSVYCCTAVTFGYPSQPKLFIDLDFGIDMKSRSKAATC